MLKRPEAGKLYGKKNPPMDDPEFQSNFPTLHSYLTQTVWDSGVARQTSTVTVYVDQGCLVVILNDRDNQRSAFINASSLFGAFAELNEQLTDDVVEWKTKRATMGDNTKVPF